MSTLPKEYKEYHPIIKRARYIIEAIEDHRVRLILQHEFDRETYYTSLEEFRQFLINTRHSILSRIQKYIGTVIDETNGATLITRVNNILTKILDSISDDNNNIDNINSTIGEQNKKLVSYSQETFLLWSISAAQGWKNVTNNENTI